ncbi:hypothetical protein BH23GEM2_BH23GEM2_09690 [soil metagenome]
MWKQFRAYVGVALIVATAACSQDFTTLGPVRVEPLFTGGSSAEGMALGALHAGTARYHRVELAVADGYVRRTACIYSAAGGRGFLYLNASLLDAVVDPAKPEVLLYEPGRNGKLHLVGVVYLVPSAAWDAASSTPPVFGGVPFYDRRTPPFGAAFPNYALFAWPWRHNPAGMYLEYNPAVTCDFTDDKDLR